mmetsp:Transcript_10221/g.11750  ORF Transcript_10221/g.11750 Transcript_10221/m.11750 type:complete len:107 (-) Transcript_10221:27-347(-)
MFSIFGREVLSVSASTRCNGVYLLQSRFFIKANISAVWPPEPRTTKVLHFDPAGSCLILRIPKIGVQNTKRIIARQPHKAMLPKANSSNIYICVRIENYAWLFIFF